MDINSVGLKLGSLASLAAFTFSSYLVEMVDLIVFAAGTSIASGAALFESMVDFVGTGVVEDVEELEEVEDELEDEDDVEQVLLSESESLSVVECPGMFPVVLSVSVWLVSEVGCVVVVVCVLIVCVFVCLWISPDLSFMSSLFAARVRCSTPAARGRWCCFAAVAAVLLKIELRSL